MPREVQPCGTPAAYRRHRVHGEEPCQGCKDAHAAATAKSVAVNRDAARELRTRHRPEYNRLLAEQSALYDQQQAAKADRARKDAEWAATFAEFEEAPDA